MIFSLIFTGYDFYKKSRTPFAPMIPTLSNIFLRLYSTIILFSWVPNKGEGRKVPIETKAKAKFITLLNQVKA